MRAWRWVRVGAALLALAAIVVQFVQVLDAGRSAVNFFSFFTIQSNLIGIDVLLWLGIVQPDPRPMLDRLRGAATVYLLITGIVYALLLSGDPAAVDATIAWVDTVLHRVMPIVMIADWLVFPPSTRITVRAAAWWIAFPLAWTAYTLVRGALVHWYPYPFLDPAVHGAAGVAGYAVGIAIAFGAVIALVAWIGNLRSARVDA